MQVMAKKKEAHPEAISAYLAVPLTRASVRRFADIEVFVEIQENVRGEDVFVVQSTSYPANDNLMELLVTLDALRCASARCTTAVIPYYGYARPDRKSGGPSPAPPPRAWCNWWRERSQSQPTALRRVSPTQPIPGSAEHASGDYFSSPATTPRERISPWARTRRFIARSNAQVSSNPRPCSAACTTVTGGCSFR
jgi:hypothetical protein